MYQYGPPVVYVSGTSESYGPDYPWSSQEAYRYVWFAPTNQAARTPASSGRAQELPQVPMGRNALMVQAQDAFKPAGKDVLVSVSPTAASQFIAAYRNSSSGPAQDSTKATKPPSRDESRFNAGDRCWLCDGEPPVGIHFAATWSHLDSASARRPDARDYDEEMCIRCGYVYTMRQHRGANVHLVAAQEKTPFVSFRPPIQVDGTSAPTFRRTASDGHKTEAMRTGTDDAPRGCPPAFRIVAPGRLRIGAA